MLLLLLQLNQTRIGASELIASLPILTSHLVPIQNLQPLRSVFNFYLPSNHNLHEVPQSACSYLRTACILIHTCVFNLCVVPTIPAVFPLQKTFLPDPCSSLVKAQSHYFYDGTPRSDVDAAILAGECQ